MNTRRAWTVYIVLRLAFFIVPFAVLMLIGWPWWLSLAISTLIALALSVIFLSKPRGEASTSIYEWRNRDRTHDDIVEDEAVDAVAAKPRADAQVNSPETQVQAPDARTNSSAAQANSTDVRENEERDN